MLTEGDILVLTFILFLLLSLKGIIEGFYIDYHMKRLDRKFSRKLQTFQARLKKGIKITAGNEGSGSWQDAALSGITEIAASNPKLQKVISKWTDKFFPPEGEEEEESE